MSTTVLVALQVRIVDSGCWSVRLTLCIDPEALQRSHVVVRNRLGSRLFVTHNSCPIKVTSYSIVASEFASYETSQASKAQDKTKPKSKAKSKAKTTSTSSGDSDNNGDDDSSSDDAKNFFGRSVAKKATAPSKKKMCDGLFRVKWWRVVLGA